MKHMDKQSKNKSTMLESMLKSMLVVNAGYNVIPTLLISELPLYNFYLHQ